MRYGCIPLVREVGGLKDTVESFNQHTNKGTGFTFANFNAHDMLHVMRLACNVHRDQKRWNILMKMAMKTDCSWKKSAREYGALYRQVMEADFHVSK